MKTGLQKAEMYSREHWKKLAKAQALSSDALGMVLTEQIRGELHKI